jgi:hypothetical protein
LETLIGVVCKVAHSNIDYPVLKGRPRMTVYVSTFEIGGRAIRFESTKPQLHREINEGDQMIVAGLVRNGCFEAIAYKNCATGVTGHQSIFGGFFVGVVFSVIGISCLVWLLLDVIEYGIANRIAFVAISILSISVFLFFGGFGLHGGFLTFQAVKALRSVP